MSRFAFLRRLLTGQASDRAHDRANVDVPAERIPGVSYQGDERRERPRRSVMPGCRALVIDDSAVVVAALGKMLRQNGFEVLEARTGEAGLEAAWAEPRPELIFLDIVMPGISGFDALRRLRRDPRTQSVPIIMISGNAEATEQFYVQRIGADDFMKKPFTRAEVFARIEKLFDLDRMPVRTDGDEGLISDDA